MEPSSFAVMLDRRPSASAARVPLRAASEHDVDASDITEVAPTPPSEMQRAALVAPPQVARPDRSYRPTVHQGRGSAPRIVVRVPAVRVPPIPGVASEVLRPQASRPRTPSPSALRLPVASQRQSSEPRAASTAPSEAPDPASVEDTLRPPALSKTAPYPPFPAAQRHAPPEGTAFGSVSPAPWSSFLPPDAVVVGPRHRLVVPASSSSLPFDGPFDLPFVAASVPGTAAPRTEFVRERPFAAVARTVARFHEEQIGPILWAIVVLGLLVAFFLGHVVGARHAADGKVSDVAGAAERAGADSKPGIVELD